MFVPFDQLADTARIWIYTSDKVFQKEEQQHIASQLQSFIETWQSHQQDVAASFAVLKDRFIVIAVDEQYHGVSGCGIDKSVHLMQSLENELQIRLTDKTTLYFENGGEIFPLSLSKIKEAVSSQQITTDSYFYNTLVSNKKELESHFLCPVLEGWTQRYFKPVPY